MIHEGTSVSLWTELIKEGEAKTNITLSENEESYIVFMLQRFLRKTEFASLPFAISYLESLLLDSKNYQRAVLNDTADASLIMAGFFPERAKRLCVSSSYFMQISRSCFLELATICDYFKHRGESSLYREVGMNIPNLAAVLYSVKNKPAEKDFFYMHSVGTIQ